MTSSKVNLHPDDMDQLSIKHVFNISDDTLSVYFKVFDSTRKIKRGFKIGMTKEMFEILAEDLDEGMEYVEVVAEWKIPGYRREENK